MKRSIMKIIAALLLATGLYGVVASAMFVKNRVFTYSQTHTEATQYYARCLQPGIEKRMAKLDLSNVSAAEQENLQTIVRWIAIDHDIARNMAMQLEIALFSLTISLFGIVLGILLLLWGRLTDLQKRIERQTQPTGSRDGVPAACDP